MAERIPTSPENNGEKNKEVEAVSHEQNERLRDNRERAAERAKETSNETEQARENLEKVVDAKEKETKKHELAETKEKVPTRQVRNKKTLEASFKTEMKDARREMSAPSRAFSKLIHNKVVEKSSEAIGSTVARPNAMLAGSATALILVGAVYLWARYAGYPLSGFETIGAFIIGWLLGIIFDFSRIMITGKR